MNLGQYGEIKAKKYLINQNYEILGTNIRWKRCQIDILTKKNQTIIAIEVKYRTNYEFFNISNNQINNISKYLEEHYPNKPIDIECVLIMPNNIKHFPILY